MRRSGIGIKGDLSVYNSQSFFFIFFVSLLNRSFDMARKRIEFSPCSLLQSLTQQQHSSVTSFIFAFCCCASFKMLIFEYISENMGSMSKIVATLFIHSSATADAVLHRNPVAIGHSHLPPPPPLTFYLPHLERISNDVTQSRSPTCKWNYFFQFSVIPCVYNLYM